ncbi:MAG: hypothetical protein FWF88_00985 [Peptococcaceae bacterium]|nr:hypothetical protein [Peptococcaceae bacterium]
MPRRALVDQNPLEYPLSPLRLSLSLVTDLTHQDVGPSSGVIFNIINCNIPYAYFLVVFLDALSAMAVKHSFFTESQMPALFETAWRNPGQAMGQAMGQGQGLGQEQGLGQGLGQGQRQGERSPVQFPGVPSPDQSSPQEDSSSDPLFPQGIGVNLLIDTPFRIRDRDSSTVFVYQIMDFPKAPPWIPPVIALIIYIVTCIQSLEKRRKHTE